MGGQRSRSGIGPRFSVVVPVYNKEQFVGRALRSVLRQTVCDLEVIAIDDGSTDGSRAELEKIVDPRVVMVSRANLGKSNTRNQGIGLARAPYVAFLDADDEWYPEFLQEVDELVSRYPEATVWATAYYIKKATHYQRPAVTGLPPHFDRGIVPSYYRTRGLLSASSVVVDRNVLQKSCGFNPTLKTSEDLEFWFRLAMTEKVAYSASPLAIWHWETNGDTKRIVPPFPSPLRMTLERLIERGLDETSIREARDFIWDLEYSQAVTLALSGDRAESWGRLRRLEAGRRPLAFALGLLLTATPTALVASALTLYRSLRRMLFGLRLR